MQHLGDRWKGNHSLHRHFYLTWKDGDLKDMVAPAYGDWMRHEVQKTHVSSG